MNWLHWALLSAFFAALTAILSKIGVTGIDSNLATAIRTAVVLGAAVLITTRTASWQAVRALEAKTWVFLALSGLATAASWLCYFRALQLGDAGRVAPVDKLSVVITVALAAIVLKEKVTSTQAMGLVLIVAGISLVTKG